MSSEVYEQIKQAIINRDQIVATYNGYYREMCPHVIGIKKDRQQGLFYQFGGDSSSGLDPAGSQNNWRCMPIEKLSDVTVRKGKWHTGANYDKWKQSCVNEIDECF